MVSRFRAMRRWRGCRAVPGVLAALKLAHDKYGKPPWSELFAPAIKLSRDGFSVSFRLAEVLLDYHPASFMPAARAISSTPRGRPGRLDTTS